MHMYLFTLTLIFFCSYKTPLFLISPNISFLSIARLISVSVFPKVSFQILLNVKLIECYNPPSTSKFYFYQKWKSIRNIVCHWSWWVRFSRKWRVFLSTAADLERQIHPLMVPNICLRNRKFIELLIYTAIYK